MVISPDSRCNTTAALATGAKSPAVVVTDPGGPANRVCAEVWSRKPVVSITLEHCAPLPFVYFSTKSSPVATPADATPTVRDARTWLREHTSARGYRCAVELIRRESGWRVTARNPRSGAYGLPQVMWPERRLSPLGADWRTSPTLQLRWMKRYVRARYIGFCRALEHQTVRGYY